MMVNSGTNINPKGQNGTQRLLKQATRFIVIASAGKNGNTKRRDIGLSGKGVSRLFCDSRGKAVNLKSIAYLPPVKVT